MKLSVVLVVLAFGASHGVRFTVKESLAQVTGDSVVKEEDEATGLAKFMVGLLRKASTVRKLGHAIPAIQNFTLGAARSAFKWVENKAKAVAKSKNPLASIAKYTVRVAKRLQRQILRIKDDLRYNKQINDELDQITPEEQFEIIKKGMNGQIDEEGESNQEGLRPIMKDIGAVSTGAAKVGVATAILNKFGPHAKHVKAAFKGLRSFVGRRKRKKAIKKDSKDSIEDEDEEDNEDDEDADDEPSEDEEQAMKSLEEEMQKEVDESSEDDDDDDDEP